MLCQCVEPRLLYIPDNGNGQLEQGCSLFLSESKKGELGRRQPAVLTLGFPGSVLLSRRVQTSGDALSSASQSPASPSLLFQK